MNDIMPICFQEHLRLANYGIKPASISFNSVTMESERFICVRERVDAAVDLVIFDLMDMRNQMRRRVSADSAIINPVSRIIALKCKENGSKHILRVFNIETKCKLKSYVSNCEITFWKWISENTLGLVTETAVYHWSMEGDTSPVKMFSRHESLSGSQVINYRSDKDELWFILIGIRVKAKIVVGNMQLYSVERKCSQPLEGFAASFAEFRLADNTSPSNLLCFAANTSNGPKMHFVEVGQPRKGNRPFNKRIVDICYPQEAQDDFPVAMQASSKYGVVYLITKYGYIYIYDIETGVCIYFNRISQDTVFVTAPHVSSGGIIGVNRSGQVLSVTVEERNIIRYINNVLKNHDLAVTFAIRNGLSGAENEIIDKFNQLFDSQHYLEAAKLSACAPNAVLRTQEVIHRFQRVTALPGQMSPILQYFGVLLDEGRLNKFESIEISRPVLLQGRKDLVEKWLKQDKLECCEELGDIIKNVDNTLALSVYLRAEASAKVVQCLAESGEFQKLVMYAKKVDYKPDYAFLLQGVIKLNPGLGLNFARVLVEDGGPLVDVEKIVDAFMGQNALQECTAFLLEALKHDRPNDGPLQTRLLEMNLSAAPQVADVIISNKIFSYYDKRKIAALCEKVGLLERALENSSDLVDIKRNIVQTHLLRADWLLDYFGTLTVEDSMECLKAMLHSNPKQNTSVCVQVALRYLEQLTVSGLINLFDTFNCNEGLYHFLSSVISTIEDEDINFKYIKAACELGQLHEVERVCKESSNYPPERVKNYLKSANLTNPTPFLIVCDRFDFVHDMILHFYKNNDIKCIETYVRNVNSNRLPYVMGVLLEVGCKEETLTSLIGCGGGEFSTADLVGEFEKRNRLDILLPWLESRVKAGCTETDTHNALAKIYVDTNCDPERFLKTNNFYDSECVGRYCERRNPRLACVAYERGRCDERLIAVFNENSLFKSEAKYLLCRKSQCLWDDVLKPQNQYRNQLVEQLIHSVLADCREPEEISVCVKAFLSAEMLNELILILENLILQPTSTFKEEKSLQNLLLLTAMKADRNKVMGYVSKLNNYDGQDVANIAINNGLYEEAFVVLDKFKINISAVDVLLDNLNDLIRATEFSKSCDDPAVWTQLGKRQLRCGLVKEAITSFINAGNPSVYREVIEAATKSGYFKDLLRYLEVAAKISRDAEVENELILAYARENRLSDLRDFISGPNHANIQKTADQCLECDLYEAAKILYNNISNFSKLAVTSVRLGEYQEAVDSAGKANKTETWKEVCFACIDGKQMRLAQVCALHIVVNADELQGISDYYQSRGHFEQLIALLEAALCLERAHMGVFTEITVLYSKYRPNKLKDHLESFWSRINIQKVIRAIEDACMWPELVFVYSKCEQYDNAVLIMIEHPTIAWNEVNFKKFVKNISNFELMYRVIRFYIDYKPLLVNDVLLTLAHKLDHTRTVNLFVEANLLPLIKPYLSFVRSDNKLANVQLISLMIEEQDFRGVKESIDAYENFDLLPLAQRLEKNEFAEFRRSAAYLYKKNKLYKRSVNLCLEEKLFKDALEFTAESQDPGLAEELCSWFLEKGHFDCFAACLFSCYELLEPDVVLELSWRHNIVNFAMPYLIQVFREYLAKVNALEETVIVQRQELQDLSSIATTPQVFTSPPHLSVGYNPSTPPATISPHQGYGL